MLMIGADRGQSLGRSGKNNLWLKFYIIRGFVAVFESQGKKVKYYLLTLRQAQNTISCVEGDL